MHAESIGPDPLTDIGQRLVSEEPMYLILNFGECARWQGSLSRDSALVCTGLSNNFQSVTFNQLSKSALSGDVYIC